MVNRKKLKNPKSIVATFLILTCIGGYSYYQEMKKEEVLPSYNIEEIPVYNGSDYIIINENKPFFTEENFTTTSYEKYSELDSLGRCGVAIANIGSDLMPTEERGSIGMVKPSGWHTIKYDIVYGKYLYNRCHLIGYQLTGEGAIEEDIYNFSLITI